MASTRAASALLLAVLVASGCEKGADSGAPKPPPTPQVGVIRVESQPLTLTQELPGRTSPFRVAEVRARVNGIVTKRLFEEGTDVKAGQALFQIDPAPYQAALEGAEAQLARAEATVTSSGLLAERYGQLIESNAVSKQEYDDVVARHKTAQADAAAARAAIKTARINLGYTTVTAPLAGRIGRAEVTEGAFVQQSTATLLATIQQLDPLYVDVTWASTEVLRLRRAIDSGELKTSGGAAEVQLILGDGSVYGLPGTLQFADVTVDESTGSIALRAVIPNPKGELLPGMFVRARIVEGEKPQAILVPQRAVMRDQNGRPTALVLNAENKVERRELVADRAVGNAWLVTEGLAVGDQVIVEGLQKVRPGADAVAVPVQPAPAPPPVAR